jgi:hypothetical protein
MPRRLRLTFPSTAKTILASAVSLLIAGQAAALSFGGRRLPIANGVLSLFGQAATLNKSGGPFSAYVPWPVWDGAIPAVPPSSTGTTYYVSSGKSDARGTLNGAPVGSNTNNGTSASTPFLTIAKALSVWTPANGDTILIRKGYYHEKIDLAGAKGTAAKPATIGSYGDGEVIIDGSQDGGAFNVTDSSWVKQGTTSVYRAQVTAGWVPTGIVIDEVPLRQIPQTYNGNANITAQTPSTSTITSGSGKWGWEIVSGTPNTYFIWADFGSKTPSTSDWFIVANTGDQHHVYTENCAYITFDGLTIRGSSNAGYWSYRTGSGRTGASDHITLRRCDIKFNGKAGTAFGYETNSLVDRCRIYHNVLNNWPRGNNGNAEAGGGWPGACNAANTLNHRVVGTVAYMNGGEGIISYGSEAGYSTGNTIFEQCISFDNWSVNMYIDNQPNDIIRQCFVFRTPWSVREADCLKSTPGTGGYPWDDMQKYTTNIMIADEYGSSDNHAANNTGARVYNNISINGRFGIRNYVESVTGTVGWRSWIVANNLIVLPQTGGNTEARGLFFQAQGTTNTGSIVKNNVIIGYGTDPATSNANDVGGSYSLARSEFAAGIGASGTQLLATLDANQFYMLGTSANTWFNTGFGSTVARTLAAWASTTGSDGTSTANNPGIANAAGLRATTAPYNYADALLSSPDTGVDLSAYFTTDFAGNTRSSWKKGPFA